MLTVTFDQFLELLQSLGVQPGDNLMIHSALQFLGKPEGGVEMYLDALCKCLGIDPARFVQRRPDESELADCQSTLAVPTFNFGFTRGQPFDRENTPSEGMGAFAELVRTQPGAYRSPHPIQSVAAIGRYAVDLARCDTPGGYDPGSSFDRMLGLDFKVLLLGADIFYTSMVQYVEQVANVPYRYWKEFTGPVRGADGECRTLTYRMFVRNLELDPQVSCKPVQKVLQERDQWSAAKLNYGEVAIFRLADYVKAASGMLAADAWAFVQNRS